MGVVVGWVGGGGDGSKVEVGTQVRQRFETPPTHDFFSTIYLVLYKFSL